MCGVVWWCVCVCVCVHVCGGGWGARICMYNVKLDICIFYKGNTYTLDSTSVTIFQNQQSCLSL